MGSTNQTATMMVTKTALLLLGLAIIGASSSAYSYPKITDLYFPTWRTTPRNDEQLRPPILTSAVQSVPMQLPKILSQTFQPMRIQPRAAKLRTIDPYYAILNGF